MRRKNGHEYFWEQARERAAFASLLPLSVVGSCAKHKIKIIFASICGCARDCVAVFFIISLQEAWKAVIVMAAAEVKKGERERKWENIKYINSMQTSFDAVVKGQSGDTHTHGDGPRWKREIHASLYSRAHIQTYPFLFWLKIPSAYYEAFYTYMYYELKTLNLTNSEEKEEKTIRSAQAGIAHTHKHFLSPFHALHLLREFTPLKFPPSLLFLPFLAKVDWMYEFLRLYFE